MTPQLDMFQPLARTSDPMPSHVAAAEMLGSPKRETECAAILDALRTSFLPLSYREVWTRLRGRIGEPVEVMRRLNDLRFSGLVTNGETRRCQESGRPAQTWKAAA